VIFGHIMCLENTITPYLRVWFYPRSLSTMKDELASLQATNSKLEVKNAFLEQALEEARSMLIETPVHTEAHKELSAKLFRANQVCINIYIHIFKPGFTSPGLIMKP
jgi:hypothetical protein